MNQKSKYKYMIAFKEALMYQWVSIYIERIWDI